MSDTNLVRETAARLRRADPRHFQIAFLGLLLSFVVLQREFTLRPGLMVLILVTALGTQALCLRLLRLPPAGPYSPLISGLSLCLLLRTDVAWVAALAAAAAIAGKFLIRARGKHLFNPSNFGLMLAVLAGPAWVSPGQWGSGTFLAFGLGGLGLMTVGKAGRLDITGSFLLTHLGLLAARGVWLGYEPAVVMHQALDGSLILFAFFMISDPRSTPDARAGRIALAILVAVLAHVLRFHLFWNHALLWALLFVSPVTPLLDLLWRHTRFQWRDGGIPHATSKRLNLDPSLVTPRG